MRSCFIFLLLCSALLTHADVPGKAKNNPCNISLQQVSALNDYTLHWKKKYGGDTCLITADTTIAIPGSGGAPDEGYFWAIHKTTGLSTDTVIFSNYYSPDKVMIISGISGNTIQYKILELSNDNKIVTTTDKDSIKDKRLLEMAEKVEHKHTRNTVFLVALVPLAIGGLITFFLYRRKKKIAKAVQGTGS